MIFGTSYSPDKNDGVGCLGPGEKAQRVLAIFGDMWNKCQLGLGHELDKIPHIYLGEGGVIMMSPL